MYRNRKNKPQSGSDVFLFQGANDCEDTGEGGQIAGIQILVHEIQSGSGNREGEERGHQCDSAPSRICRGETSAAQLPAGEQEQKDRRKMPPKKSVIEG